jgi:hypothetical protein
MLLKNKYALGLISNLNQYLLMIIYCSIALAIFLMVIKINHLESLQNRLDQIYKWVTPGPIQSSPSLTVRRLELPGNAKEVVRGHCLSAPKSQRLTTVTMLPVLPN